VSQKVRRRGMRVFRRVSWWLYFVNKIEVDEQGICFKMFTLRTYAYKWVEVRRVVLREIEGAEVGSVLAGPPARGLKIETGDGRKFRINIGRDRQSQDLLAEIRKYTQIHRAPIRRENLFFAMLMAALLISIIVLGMRKGLEGEIVGLGALFIVGLYYFINKRFF
jgi:hypothetical protein